MTADTERKHRAGADEPALPAAAPRSERLLVILVGIVTVVGLLAVAAGVLAYHANDKANRAEQAKASASQQAGALYSQAASAGITPAVTPSGAKPANVAGPSGPPGPGASDQQITVAVARYCRQHDACKGTPSQQQVRAAVAAYCLTACRGSKGASGQPGAAGASGQPGTDGEGPSADDVATAVASYCAQHGECTGPAGPSGPPGPSGPAGPACPEGYELKTVTPLTGPSYVQCQAADDQPASSSSSSS